jgi:hypothetical protein
MMDRTSTFIKVWQNSPNIAAARSKLLDAGIQISEPSMRKKASHLRGLGIQLKRFGVTGVRADRDLESVEGALNLAKMHVDENTEWQTPEWLAAAATELMGGIDLDPASSKEANRTIGASKFYTRTDDGLTKRWSIDGYPSKVFLNPPGRQVPEFWDKLIEEWDANRVLTAFWVGFNVDHLRWMLTKTRHPFEFYVCIPRSRIKFVHPVADGKKKPSCANYLVWLPDEDCNENWHRFCEVMGKYGRCIRGGVGHYSGEPYSGKHFLLGVTHGERRVRSAVRRGGAKGDDANGSPE